MKTVRVLSLLCALSIAAFAAPAQNVLTMHRLPAALASEAVAAAVAKAGLDKIADRLK